MKGRLGGLLTISLYLGLCSSFTVVLLDIFISVWVLWGSLIWTLHVRFNRRRFVFLCWDFLHHRRCRDGENAMGVDSYFDFHSRFFSIFLCRNILNYEAAYLCFWIRHCLWVRVESFNSKRPPSQESEDFGERGSVVFTEHFMDTFSIF